MAGLKSALSAAAEATPPITTAPPPQHKREDFTINPPGPVTACSTLPVWGPKPAWGSQDWVGVVSRPHIWDPHLLPAQDWSSRRPWPLACSGVNTVTLR